MYQLDNLIVECEIKEELKLRNQEEILNIIIESIDNIIIKRVIDERGDQTYLGEFFKCEDEKCLYYHIPHKHLKNVNLNNPDTPIKKEDFKAIQHAQGNYWDNRYLYDIWRHIHILKEYIPKSKNKSTRS